MDFILIVEDDRALADGLCRALTTPETMASCCATLHQARELLQTTSV